jgi:hypothetical protein
MGSQGVWFPRLERGIGDMPPCGEWSDVALLVASVEMKFGWRNAKIEMSETIQSAGTVIHPSPLPLHESQVGITHRWEETPKNWPCITANGGPLSPKGEGQNQQKRRHRMDGNGMNMHTGCNRTAGTHR